MGIYSSGNKYRTAAKQFEQYARDLQAQQNDIDFGRNLLANIRQQRLAASELASYNYSDDFVSSSAAGAQANLASTLAGEVGYAYSTTERAERIQSLQQRAQAMYEKYAKQQKRRATAIQLTSAAVGAAGGFLVGGTLAATAIGGQLGLGGGQIATGNTAEGVSNILSAGLSAYSSMETPKKTPLGSISEAGGFTSTASYSVGGRYVSQQQFAGLW